MSWLDSIINATFSWAQIEKNRSVTFFLGARRANAARNVEISERDERTESWGGPRSKIVLVWVMIIHTWLESPSELDSRWKLNIKRLGIERQRSLLTPRARPDRGVELMTSAALSAHFQLNQWRNLLPRALFAFSRFISRWLHSFIRSSDLRGNRFQLCTARNEPRADGLSTKSGWRKLNKEIK